MEITQVIARPQNFIASDIASALQDIADVEEDTRLDREEQDAAVQEAEDAEYEAYLADLEADQYAEEQARYEAENEALMWESYDPYGYEDCYY